jgi:hypothetical protein
VRDPPFELEDRPIRGKRQRLQGRLFFGEGLINDTLSGCVDARIGHRIEPMPQLGIEIVKVTEGVGYANCLTPTPQVLGRL